MDWYQITAIALSTFAVGSLLGHAVGYGKGKTVGAAQAKAEARAAYRRHQRKLDLEEEEEYFDE